MPKKPPDAEFVFDQPIVNDDGEYDEEAATRYDDQLLERFGKSPEYRAFREAGGDGGYLPMFLDLARSYESLMPATMTASDVTNVLLRLFPRKVSCPADVVPDLVREQRAFWMFLDREFGATRAAACAKALDADFAADMQEAMADRSNFGMAKSFFGLGEQAGFDLASPQGLAAWMAAYNAAVMPSGVGGVAPGRRSGASKKKAKPKPRRRKPNERGPSQG